MNHAKVAGPPPGNQGEANKFEITSEIAKFRFFVKADHPLEAIRWVEDLKAHIDYASGTLTRRPSSSERNGSISSKLGMSIDLPKADMSSASVGSMTPNVIPPTPLASKDSSSHIEKRSTAASNEEKSGSSSISATLSRKLSTSTLKKLVPGKHSSSHLSSQSNNLSDASSANLSSTSLVRSSHGSSDSLSIPMLSSPASLRPHDDSVDNSSINSLHEENLSNRAPHEENFMLLANSAKAQVETTSSLLATLNVEEGAAADAQQIEVVHALRQSVKRVQAMLEEYVDQVTDREKWFCRRYEAEIEARQLWEDNLTNLAKQHVELEQELQKEAQKGSRRKKELRNLQARGSSPSLTALNSQPTSPKSASKLVESREKDQEVHGRDRSNTIRPPQGTTGVGVGGAANANEEHVAAKDATYQYVEESSDEEDDEFFEAVEAGTLDMSVDPPLTEPPSAVFHEKDLPPDIKDKLAEKDLVYAGYMNPRTELPIGVDDRPNVSLWSILKNSIGKDLTKISFPVSFNEPTSMLQRMAEDMEFSEVLDAAVMHKDPAERIAFVAAFAMSNYSSTIGRIAKPFNPMLSETFEYVSVDKRYRYMSEQVSHHPPISACIAESPNYRYFGEVDAKNKFMGKSFEIRPTGVAHCELRLPTETAPDYPADDQGLASEHYSWKKVTSSVSNFIWGSPIIDHYGDMVVTNHRTGDTCTLTFKPRGWKGSNTSEIKGKVVDGSGKLRLDIAGRWSTQLVARRAGEGSGELQPDAPLSDQPEYILLWKNSEKPANSPFNLTPYAITLNGKDDSLVPWLPPTDCRLRPDLHAFEAGKFEEANTLKIGLEEIQRTTRRNRETGELPPHRPRWFTHMTEGDTQEGYWKPSRLSDGTLEYWTERERVGKAKVQGQDAEWTNVTPIFGDYALL